MFGFARRLIAARRRFERNRRLWLDHRAGFVHPFEDGCSCDTNEVW